MDLIARLAADSAIRAVITGIALLGDLGQPEDYAQIYSADAVWEWGETRDEGLEQIVATTKARRAQGIGGPGSGSKHGVQVMSVELVDEVRARAVSYFTFYTHITGDVRVGPVGTYRDELALIDGSWKITRRTASPE